VIKLCFLTPLLFHNPNRGDVLVVKSESQPEFFTLSDGYLRGGLEGGDRFLTESEVIADIMYRRTATFLLCSAVLAANKLQINIDVRDTVHWKISMAQVVMLLVESDWTELLIRSEQPGSSALDKE
jgi:hypothetical protein